MRMERKVTKPDKIETRFTRLRTTLTLGLLCVFALTTLRTEAIYYRNTIKGPRGRISTVDRSKIQPPGDPNVVGKLGRDEAGNAVVRWPIYVNGNGGLFCQESLVLGQYETEDDFLKAYLEKCKVRGGQPNDRRVLGEDYERKRIYKNEGKKMWAEHLEVLRATRAKEKERKVE